MTQYYEKKTDTAPGIQECKQGKLTRSSTTPTERGDHQINQPAPRQAKGDDSHELGLGFPREERDST